MLLFAAILASSSASVVTRSSVHKSTVDAAAYSRTRCGSPSAKAGLVDIPSKWAALVTPASVSEPDFFGHPRPQLRRADAATFHSLNGLWEFQPATEGEIPPFGRALNESVLVPFPVESCLSGLRNRSAAAGAAGPRGVPPTYKYVHVVLPLLPFLRVLLLTSALSHRYMFYRTEVDGAALLLQAAAKGGGGRALLHFGAVDWQADVYVNGLWVGGHEGGYDSFSFDVTAALQTAASRTRRANAAASAGGGHDEVMVAVHDPSNGGSQPFGKQRTSAMWRPAGDTYSPNSGIWQPVIRSSCCEFRKYSLLLIVKCRCGSSRCPRRSRARWTSAQTRSSSTSP